MHQQIMSKNNYMQTKLESPSVTQTSSCGLKLHTKCHPVCLSVCLPDPFNINDPYSSPYSSLKFSLPAGHLHNECGWLWPAIQHYQVKYLLSAFFKQCYACLILPTVGVS